MSKSLFALSLWLVGFVVLFVAGHFLWDRVLVELIRTALHRQRGGKSSAYLASTAEPIEPEPVLMPRPPGNRRVRAMMLWIVLIDAAILGIASWLFVRGTSQYIPLAAVALVWIGTFIGAWLARRKIHGQ
jgi:uncharacterized membrane protein YfcA